MALRQLRQLKQLTDGLLDVARVRQGKMELKKELVDLITVVGAALETTRPAIEGRGHELKVSLPPGRVPVNGDPSRLQQVIVNLLNNACKYTAPMGQIRVAVEGTEGEAVVRVEDTGIGLAPEMLEGIFKLYAQAADGRRHSEGGLGIGLSLVKCLVEMHGGSVTAESDGLGRGSTFVVRLPVREAIPAQGPAPVPEKATAGTRSLRVLLVDDNLDSTRSLAQLLRMWGHEVDSAADGEEAVRLSTRYKGVIHLLLTDVIMPGMNGLQVADQLTTLRPGLKVLYMSGYAGDAVFRLDRLGPGTSFLSKLFAPKDLAIKVRGILDG